MKLNKKKFLKTELGEQMCNCIVAWDRRLEECNKYDYCTEEYQRARETATWRQAQWEVYQMVLRQFYGMDYHFSRTDEYFGICTNDETDWLFKVER